MTGLISARVPRRTEGMDVAERLTRALAAGRWPEAEEILGRLAAGGHPSVFYNLGRVKMELGKWAEARVWLTRCVAAAPGHAHGWFELGRTALELADLDTAGQAFARAMALDPTDADARVNLARICLRQGQYAPVREALAPLAGHSAEVDALRYRAAAELGLPEAEAERAALWSRPGGRAEALKALTRVAKGRLPLDL